VIAYTVSQRSREIGIRMALGARRGELTFMFVRQGLALAGGGAALGLLAALASSRFMGALLFGVGTADPTTYALVAVALVSTAALASYLPARRVSAIDPAEALRAD
jgi:ABC-type antimicrobial peptide transport system permease subunit